MAEEGFEPAPQGHEPCMLTVTLFRRNAPLPLSLTTIKKIKRRLRRDLGIKKAENISFCLKYVFKNV